MKKLIFLIAVMGIFAGCSSPLVVVFKDDPISHSRGYDLILSGISDEALYKSLKNIKKGELKAKIEIAEMINESEDVNITTIVKNENTDLNINRKFMRNRKILQASIKVYDMDKLIGQYLVQVLLKSNAGKRSSYNQLASKIKEILK